MESTPLREAVRKTQLDLTLSGIKYHKYRNYVFDPETLLPSTIVRKTKEVATPIQRPIPPRKLPAVPQRYHQSLENIPSKTPLPEKSLCSPTKHNFKQSTLERQRTNITGSLRKSGSLSALPTSSHEAEPMGLATNYTVGQPELKLLTRTPRNITPKRLTMQFADPYVQYSTIGMGRAESTLKRHRASLASKFSIQSSPRGSLTPTTKRNVGLITKDQRYRVAKEILKTEETYVQNLRTLTSFFYRPLLKAKLVPPHELKQLFPSQLNALLNCHTELLDKLCDRLSNTKWQGMIGDIFANLCSGSMSMDFFQMYSGYVLAFPSALAVYEKQIRTNEEFRGFIRACMDSPSCGGLDLCAFLLTPIQRLPRYLLLLKELIKFTDSSHPDSYFANLAVDKFKACLILLNDSIHLVLDIASKSTAWQGEPRAKTNTRSNKTLKKSKKSCKRASEIFRTASNSDLGSNGSSIYVESCPPSLLDNSRIQSPVNYEKHKKPRVLQAPANVNAAPTAKEIESRNDRELETRKLTLQVSIDDKIPFSPPPLTSNKSHTDSGIYEEDPDLNQDEIPPVQLRTPIPENSSQTLPNHNNTTSTRTTLDKVDDLSDITINNINTLLESPVQKMLEIDILDAPEINVGTKEKKHFRRRSTDRILRLFKIFKSK